MPLLFNRSRVIYCIIVLGRVLDKLGFKPALEDSEMVDAFRPEDKEIDSAGQEADSLIQAEEGNKDADLYAYPSIQIWLASILRIRRRRVAAYGLPSLPLSYLRSHLPKLM